MLLDLVRVTGPANQPVSLDQAKRQVKLEPDETENDEELGDILAQATEAMDGYAGWLGRALITQQWKLCLPGFWAQSHPDVRPDYFPPGLLTIWPHRHQPRIRLPLPPLQSVQSVAYVDTTGTAQTLSSSLYTVIDGPRGELAAAPGQTWPDTQDDNPRAVTITFTCGYGDTADDVPSQIKRAILLIVGHWYEHKEAVVGVENRDSSTELPLGARAMIDLIRRQRA